MPLPNDPTMAWPPKALKPILSDVAEADAWYSGDAERLRGFYGRGDGSSRPEHKTFDEHGGTQAGGVLGKVKFWQRRAHDSQPNRLQLHIPLAADIASASADLLFSEQPRFTVPRESANPDRPDSSGQATQDRLDELVDEAGIANTLLEAAEVAAALGDVYLRAVWDPNILDHPVIDVVHADAAWPEWRWGRLAAVTFWTVLLESEGKIWRHLERHEDGVILHGLYVGGRDKLGRRVHMGSHPTTEALLDGDDRTYDEDTDELAVPLPAPLTGLVVRHVPNVRPNRKHRGTMHGRSDFAGTFSMMDALDETWTSWMRDIRLGQSRVIVSQQALDLTGRGKGASFDVDRELFTGIEVEPGPDQKPVIEQVQFALRVEEHERTAMALIERAVSTAGYSPQSFGLQIDGRAESGSALRIREGKTLRTGGRKQRYWQPPILDLLEILLVLDAAVHGNQVEPRRPSMVWGDSLVDDPREQAETLQMLATARAASIKTRVQIASPHLEGDELEAEVASIMAEQGMAVADPAGFGD